MSSTCEFVANTVRKKLDIKTDYQVGEYLICRKFLKMKSCRFHVNYEYVISGVQDTLTTSKEKSSGDEDDEEEDIKTDNGSNTHDSSRSETSSSNIQHHTESHEQSYESHKPVETHEQTKSRYSSYCIFYF